ncbi:MAG: heavy metal translocating P-type ATPase metal-binding domain-containing protein [Bacteroidetes bacterium]|nr:heavy metal translocating P-type ATPase metal-binding domain-containing protein [Bacteroidota bacterium]MDA1120949.1 heavy metal translocating P-type ATPase metal-binding domain-containing protein [Bacteroidota bacterium]
MLISDKVKCYHCGDDCRDGIISSYDKSFCCTGCKLVFELLEENGLTSYYNIQKSPGTRQNTRNEFGYLDNETIANQILEFKSHQMNRVTFRLPEIHCSACIYLLENLPRINPSIIRSEVNFLRKEASIDYDSKEIKLSEVADLLQLIGYSAEVNLEKKEANQQKNASRVLGMKIGVAGFCFGNVMLFSFPEYLGLDSLTEGAYRQFFSWACLVLSLPAFFYCGIGYVTSAFKSLQQKFLNLDVPIALGMITLLFRSTYEITTNSGIGYLDSLTGLIFFLLIGKWFQSSTYDFLSFERDYKSYFPLAVSVIQGNKVEIMQLDSLQVGHVIEVRNNEIIPADAELLDSKVVVDYSFVTGESENLVKRVGDQLYAGGKVIGTSVKMKVLKEVSKSYLTRLWNQDGFNQQPDQFRSLSDQISKFFTLTVIVIAISASFFWWITNPSKIWEVFTAILIVACPCALALAAPFTLGSALRVFGRHHLYLKNTGIIEKMAQLTTIVFDKTGTVTLPSNSLLSNEMNLSEDEKLMVAALARQSTHPLSRQIYQTLSSDKDVIIKNFHETPGLGISGNAHGNEILLGSSEYILGGQMVISWRTEFTFRLMES